MDFLWSYTDSNNLFSVYDGPGIDQDQSIPLDSGLSQWYDLCMESLMRADVPKLTTEMKERNLLTSLSDIYKDLKTVIQQNNNGLKAKTANDDIDWVLQNSGPYILAYLYKIAYSVLMDLCEDEVLFSMIPSNLKIKDNLTQFISLYQPLYAHNKAIQPLDSFKKYLPLSAKNGA